MAVTGDFFAGLGSTLLSGVGKAIDGEALQRYGTYGGQVVADTAGNTTRAGTPFTDTLASTFSSPKNLLLLAGAAVLGLVLLKRVL